MRARGGKRRQPGEAARFVEVYSAGRRPRHNMNAWRARLRADVQKPRGQRVPDAMPLESGPYINVKMRRIALERRAEVRREVIDGADNGFGGGRKTVDAASQIAGGTAIGVYRKQESAGLRPGIIAKPAVHKGTLFRRGAERFCACGCEEDALCLWKPARAIFWQTLAQRNAPQGIGWK